jgi:O-6-methylguanine DNA methyltransferase
MKNNKQFTRLVLRATAKIPYGRVATYSQIAKAAKSPRAYRAVGNILNRNFRNENLRLPLIDNKPVPCHRVVKINGAVGGFAKGENEKIRLLSKEKIIIKDGKINLRKYLWNGYS